MNKLAKRGKENKHLHLLKNIFANSRFAWLVEADRCIRSAAWISPHPEKDYAGSAVARLADDDPMRGLHHRES
jgi:hypothetical protein